MNLETSYMGLTLKHPIVASASPLSESMDGMRRLADAGASAIVMFSLFEEQLRHEAEAIDHLVDVGSESFGEALSYFPQLHEEFHVGPDRYLELLNQASSELDIPVIASLNGMTTEGWIDHARLMEEAGADGIELNLYFIAANASLPGHAVEKRYLDVLRAVKYAVQIPVALKLSAFFSSFAHIARLFAEEGADALVLFNRFYQPDFDLEALEVSPGLKLSSPEELLLRLRWAAILYGRIQTSLAITGGVHSGIDVVKCMMAGADVAMTTSALLKHGVEKIGTMQTELKEWMEQKEYESVEQMKGSMSQQNVDDPSALERANYIRVLENYKSSFSI